MTRILVIDDEPELLRALNINLRAHGYEVDSATDGSTALRHAAAHPPDLAILDLGLPDMDGVEVIHGLRGWTHLPIVVLSAREGQTDKVSALDAGADDYLTKPFGMRELMARVRAALRRARPVQDEPTVHTEHFSIDLAAKKVTTADGEEVRLTPTEWHLLEILAKNADRLVARKQLLTEIWGPAYVNETNYLRVYVAGLRRKLEPEQAHPRYIITEPGLGYRFEP